MKRLVTCVLLTVSIFGFSQSDRNGTIVVKKATAETVTVSKDSKSDRPDTSYINNAVLLLSMPGRNPYFPGGDNAMLNFIDDNIVVSEKDRAIKKKKYGIQGTIINDVYVTFKIDADGSLSEARVLRPSTVWLDCDSEAIRLVSLMPNWVPAERNGVKVPMEWTVDVKFLID